MFFRPRNDPILTFLAENDKKYRINGKNDFPTLATYH